MIQLDSEPKVSYKWFEPEEEPASRSALAPVHIPGPALPASQQGDSAKPHRHVTFLIEERNSDGTYGLTFLWSPDSHHPSGR